MNKKAILFGVAALALAIQLVPSKIEEQNGLKAIAWDSPRTEALAQRACMACHGGTPPTPWYTKIAPVSWFTNHHVNEGREHLDFATRHKVEIDEISDEIREGEMPLSSYTWLHPEAKLSESEKEALITGLQKTFGTEQAPH